MNFSFQELEELYNQAPCGYYALDLEGKIIQINDTALKMLGYKREEVLGRQFSKFITPESWLTWQRNFPILKQRGWFNDRELQFIRQDGS